MKQIRRKPFLLSSRGISLPFSHSHHGGSFHIAYAHHDNNRNVPDEWMSNYQGAPIYHLSGNRQEMIFLTCFPLLEQKVACKTLFFQFFFQLFQSSVNRTFHRHLRTSLQFCDPFICHTIKKIQNQPAFLNLREFLYCPV